MTLRPHAKAAFLPPEILDRIFRILLTAADSQSSDVTRTRSTELGVPEAATDVIVHDEGRSNSHEVRSTLYSCCLVSHAWYFSAVAVLWNRPVFPNIASFVVFLKQCHRVGVQRRNRADPKNNMNHRKSEKRKKLRRSSEGFETRWIAEWGMENIRTFDVRPTAHLGNFIQPSHLALLADARPELHHLSLTNCRNLNDADIVAIVAAVAPTLSTLELTGCWRVTDVGVQIIAHLCAPWNALRTLILRHVGLVSDVGVMAIATNLARNLIVCDLSHCRRISEVGLIKLLEHTAASAQRDTTDQRGSLVELRFTGANITRAAFKLVLHNAVHHHPDLKILEFSAPEPPKGSANVLYRAFPINLLNNLSQLHLSRANFLSKEHFILLADTVCPHLTHLTLADAALPLRETLKYLLTRCTSRLRWLSLRRSYAVTDDLLLHLAAQPCMPHITYLDLRGCRFVHDIGIGHLCDTRNAPSPTLNEQHQGYVTPPARGPLCAASLAVIKLCACPHLTLMAILTLVHALSPRAGGSLDEIHVDGESLATDYPAPVPAQLGIDVLAAVPRTVGVGDPDLNGHKNARWTEIIKGHRLQLLDACMTA